MSVNMLVILKLSNMFTRKTLKFLGGQSVSSCDKPLSTPRCHNRVNVTKSKKTVCDPSAREVITTDFSNDVTRKQIKLVLFSNFFTNLCLVNALVLQVLVTYVWRIMLVFMVLVQVVV